MIKKPRP